MKAYLLPIIDEIDTPKKITDYLKAEGFIIDFIQDKLDDYGNLYAYFKYEENYWMASFSCVSKGMCLWWFFICFLYFKILKYIPKKI
ncbi:MAG: hypothetical protein R2799_16560 [Crocinitomicaceae bacterium]